MLNARVPPTTYLLTIPDGPQGTREVLKVMRDIVRRAKFNPANRDVAVQIVARVPWKDFEGEGQAIMDFMRREFRYTLDTNDVEVVQTPQQTLRLGYGDCDDFCVFAATMCECLGHPARFLAMGFDLAEGYSHVIVQTRLAGGDPWLSLDATEPHEFGWAPPEPRWTLDCEI